MPTCVHTALVSHVSLVSAKLGSPDPAPLPFQVQRPPTDKPRDIHVAICPTGIALYVQPWLSAGIETSERTRVVCALFALYRVFRYITRKGVTTEEYHAFADISQWTVLEEGDAFAYWADEDDLVVLQTPEVRTVPILPLVVDALPHSFFCFVTGQAHG